MHRVYIAYYLYSSKYRMDRTSSPIPSDHVIRFELQSIEDDFLESNFHE